MIINACTELTSTRFFLNFEADTKKGELTAAFWYEDTPNQFDSFNNANTGFQMRKQLSVGCRAISLMGQVHVDLFAQGLFMIDGLNMHVKFTRLPAAFSIMQTNIGDGEALLPNYKIKIKEIALYV